MRRYCVYLLFLALGFSYLLLWYYPTSRSLAKHTSKNTARVSRLYGDVPDPSERFQPVDESNHTFVHSAHLDMTFLGRSQAVRVVALTLRRKEYSKELLCLLRFNGSAQLTNASVIPIPEDHGFRYTSAFVVCPLRPGFQPSSVSVLNGTHGRVLNHMPIAPSTVGPERGFTVCVPPLHGFYGNRPQLIEYMEVNQLFGASAFVFYNNSVSEEVSRLLQSYVSDGLAVVVNWKLPFPAYTRHEGYTNIHYFGQLAATNDCLYRNRRKTRYILSPDLDELIVPRSSRTWDALLSFHLRMVPLGAAFVFRTYLFYTFKPDHPVRFAKRDMAEKYRSLSLLKTNRTLSTLPMYSRTKFIYNPTRVAVVGIHNIWEYLDKFRDVNLEPEDGSVNHYSEALITPTPPGTIIDTHMHTYQYQIVERLQTRWKQVPFGD